MSTLPLRNLGQTDIKLSPLGLGTWQFSGGKGMIGGYWDALDAQTTHDIVKTAIDGGINWFDTAQAYGNGESERNLAKALKSAQISADDIHIATKWWPVLKTANNLKASINDRLECLGGFPIAHHIVHQPLSISSIDKQMHAMADLMDAGKIQSVGVSNFSAKAMHKAHKTLESRGYVLAANQVRYSMVTRTIEHNGILDTAKELGISIIAWSPLEQGLLTGRFHTSAGIPKSIGFARRGMMNMSGLKKTQALINAMTELSDKYQASVSQIALNYTVTAHGDTIITIPGASKKSQVEQNLGAMQFQLDAADTEGLTRLL